MRNYIKNCKDRIEIYAIISIILLFLLTGCNVNMEDLNELCEPLEQQEEPHLYWKDIDVVITDVKRRHWYTGAHWYSVELTVESKEYGLTEFIEISGKSAWNYEEGQTVKAELYSWVMDSTGEVIRRKINRIY